MNLSGEAAVWSMIGVIVLLATAGGRIAGRRHPPDR